MAAQVSLPAASPLMAILFSRKVGQAGMPALTECLGSQERYANHFDTAAGISGR
jgi:hypothetical protein